MARSIRKDQLALQNNGELSETAAAKRIGVTSATLSKWRRNSFAAQGFAPSFRQVHKRLVAYKAATVEALVQHLQGPRAMAA